MISFVTSSSLERELSVILKNFTIKNIVNIKSIFIKISHARFAIRIGN